MPDHFRSQPKNPMGPRSPTGSDSPLSLVIGGNSKKDHHHLIQQHKAPPPQLQHNHSSSGYSNGESPGESPVRRPDQDETKDENKEAPLSLVVVKNSDGYSVKPRHDDSGHDSSDDRSRSPVAPPTPTLLSTSSAASSPPPPRPNHDQGQPRPNHDQDHDLYPYPEQKRDEKPMTSDQLIIAKVGDAEDFKKAIKIKDFARFNLGEDARERIPTHINYEQTLAALTGPSRMKFRESSDHQYLPMLVTSHGPEDNISDNQSDVSSVDTWTTMSEASHHFIMAKRIGDQTVYPCDFCDKVFANKYHLQSHIVTHTGERSFECRACGKTFGRKSTLRAHMTTHTKTSNFMCPLCEKACNDNNSLEEHIRMHTGEKPFVCTICAKAYARKSHLNVHYRVHTGERPFVCVDCGKDFTEKRFLNDHMQTAHSGHDGPLKCPNCYREFAYKTSLKQHLKKQMCVKNLNRGQGSSNHGVHAKQFACPFCEKSYSWKQTLKQHVSMYHRNKVHTDEFWKYELAKHRRTVLDSKTNEDMWKKQLGRHADDMQNPQQQRSLSLGQDRRGSLNLENQDKWLDQIHRSTGSNPRQNAQVSAEMKLLALQSLQSSLHFMSMGIQNPMNRLAKRAKSPEPKAAPATPPPPQQLPPPPPPVQQRPQQEGYLSLLAHISAQRKAEDKLSEEKANYEEWQRKKMFERPQSPSLTPPMLPDIKEEPAAKRTQMWLAQLGRYRQRSIQEEMDRNHDELWEEQIAKIKQKPIKSPLEPIEITIEDEDARMKMKQQQPMMRMVPLMSALQCPPPKSPPKVSRPLTPPPEEDKVLLVTRPPPALSPMRSSPPNNVISIKTSNIHRIHHDDPVGNFPRNRTFSLALEMNNNNNNNNNPVVTTRHIPLPLLPSRNENQVMVKTKKILEVPDHEEDTKKTSADSESASVLKSLLMDRMMRKRPSSPLAAKPVVVKKTPPSLDGSSGSADETDILRRRLLGLKEQQQQQQATALLPKPRFQPPSATITSQQAAAMAAAEQEQQQKCTTAAIDLSDKTPPMNQEVTHKYNEEEPQKKKQRMSYTQTSVLKHLLYRYTSNDNNNSSD